MLTGSRSAELLKEVSYKTSRSGGKGGQNVNKVESKVELIFLVNDSHVLLDSEKTIILSKLSVTEGPGEIRLVCDKHRSQLENKLEAGKKLIQRLNNYLKPVKRRTATKPTKASRKKRLDSKKKHSQKKLFRKKDF